MWRFSIVGRIGTGTDADPYRADVGAGWVLVAEWPAAGHCLVKQKLPDGTAVESTTMADVAVDAGGHQVGILGAALNATQREAITTWLQGQGLDTSWISSTMITRQLFLFGLLRYLADRPDLDMNAILSSYNVA